MTATKKVDLDDFKREIARLEINEKQNASIQLVQFKRNHTPGKKDPIGAHPTNGAPVFPDKFRLGSKIKEGEAWFCELDEKSSGGSRVYHANPIRRVDAAFLFDLRSDQVDTLVETLRSTEHGKLLEQARAQIKVQLEQGIRNDVDTLRAERDAARAEVADLKALLQRSEEAAGALRLKVDSLSRGALSGAAVEGTALKAADERRTTTDASKWDDIEDASVLMLSRPASDELQSPWFKADYYKVLVSPDRRTLFIRAEPDGGIPAIGRRITVPDLGLLRRFDAPEKLVARIDSRRQGLLVDLGSEMA